MNTCNTIKINECARTATSRAGKISPGIFQIKMCVSACARGVLVSKMVIGGGDGGFPSRFYFVFSISMFNI